MRLRWAFLSERTRARNRVHALLAREGLRYPGTDLFDAPGRRWAEGQVLRPPVQALVAQQLDHVDTTAGQVEALTQRLREALRGVPAVTPLMTIPGVGFITAATLLAELGHWQRFGRPKQVAAYFGLVPTMRASAHTAHYGHVTKQGSTHARRVLVEAAPVAVRLPGPARHRYLSLVRRRGKRVAVMAAARVLLILAWTLLGTGEVYQLPA